MLINEFIIGSITLNISTLLYFMGYWPQLRHNEDATHLKELSLQFHYLLLLGNWTDLMYALAMDMPVQYQLVSIIGMGCVFYQHYQLWCLYRNKPHFKWLTSLIFVSMMISIEVFVRHITITPIYLFIGYISQACYIIYLVPQVIRNQKLRSAQSLSVSFLLFTGCSSLCDNFSAWCLHWPLPNKLGSAVQLMLVLTNILQWYYYNYSAKLDKDSVHAMV